MLDDGYIIEPNEPHEHVFDYRTLVCMHCGISAEAVEAGRDRLPTWDDVDEAFKDGRRLGIELGQLMYKHARRQKLIEVGYWLALRRIRSQWEKND